MNTPLRAARFRAGKTLKEIADLCGMTVASLSRIERAQQRPTAATAELLAQVVGEISEMEILYPERFIKRGRSGKAA